MKAAPETPEGPRASPQSWLVAVNAACAALRSGALDAPGWASAMRKLMAAADRPALLDCLGFAGLVAGIAWRERGETSLKPALPEGPGLERPLAFMPRIFALRRWRAIPPHAHEGVASAFLVLRGVVQGRLWDRVGTAPGGLRLRPVLDRTLAAGDHLAMTQFDANVHGYRAVSETAFLLVVNVSRLAGADGGRVYLDPSGAPGADGLLVAPLLAEDEAYRRLG